MELGWDFGAILSSIFAIIISIFTWYETNRIGSYADIDLLYLELLKLGIEHPRFTNPNFTADYENSFEGDELNAYSIYAFISWNICETIFDRCGKVSELWDTWEPVITTENKIHRRWLDNPDNFHKFKEKFIDFINSTYPKEYDERSLT